MRNAVLAATLSLALHAVGLAIFVREGAPTVVAVAGPREKPVQIEVMRLAGLVGAPAKSPPAAAAAVAPRPPVRSPASSPAVEAAPTPPSAAAEPGPREPEGDGPAGEPAPGGGEGAGEPAADPGQGSSGSAATEATTGREAPLDTTALSRRLQQVALRCYPAAARRFRQTGQAQIRFCLDAAGALRESTVLQSTGSALLDHAATDCVVPGAAPFGPETFGRCFAVPVRFNP